MGQDDSFRALFEDFPELTPVEKLEMRLSDLDLEWRNRFADLEAVVEARDRFVLSAAWGPVAAGCALGGAFLANQLASHFLGAGFIASVVAAACAIAGFVAGSIYAQRGREDDERKIPPMPRPRPMLNDDLT